MGEITISVMSDDILDGAVAKIIIAKAFIDLGASNIISPLLSEQTMESLTRYMDPEILDKCKNTCKIIIN